MLRRIFGEGFRVPDVVLSFKNVKQGAGDEGEEQHKPGARSAVVDVENFCKGEEHLFVIE